MAVPDQNQIIKSLANWGNSIKEALDAGELDELLHRAYAKNNFFTVEFSRRSIESIISQYLAEEKLRNWISKYSIPTSIKKVGILMAGNIPVVGAHDLISVLISGNTAHVKLASKDEVLIPGLLQLADESTQSSVLIVNMLKGIDAVIATGSDNSSRYFEYYFKDKSNIIRKNRTSVAVLDGSESPEDLLKLGDDIFSYFGLGCRNVSKLMLPENYDPKKILEVLEHYKYMMDLDKYKNNYDYSFAILMMKNIQFLTNDVLMLIEDDNIYSGVATLHYEFYKDQNDLNSKLLLHQDEIQCKLDNNGRKGYYKFGSAQSPELDDYADGIDTLDFLSKL